MATQLDCTRRFPDFFVIGAAKSGTTTLHEYLARHPDLWMSADKEPCFFDPNVAPELRDPETYHGLFNGAREDQLCAESSTNYAMWPLVPNVPRSISLVNPDARFIYLLRDPLRRCYSHFMHRHEREVLRDQPYRMTFEEYLNFDPIIADASDYAAQVRRYLEYFPKQSLLLLSFERFVKDPVSTLKQVFDFLGVDDRSEEDGGEPLHSNNTDAFKSIMMRSYTMAPLRRIPGLRAVYERMPSNLRAASISWIQKSPLGRRARRRLTPPPILPETRNRLQERFDASTAYLEAEFGFDASCWSSDARG
ncbi:MAG: sulfotransferase [Paludisphaera borealis]|uniref:sulfotransferase family protein n=1 Tax=Paludisphaera borealis TaxID=1387353 RepID=UPI00283CD850|nr:sulfotransferase [Paludisphaera borealis]MDR3623503.1 sulfotransferase [Paludisphaera borealis]